MATWPASLPPIRLPASFQLRDNVIRTQMDAGPAKTRPRSTTEEEEVSFKLELTGSQCKTLVDFYQDTLSGGALEFTFEHPRTGDEETFRFTSPPGGDARRGAASVGDRLWDVTVNLEKLP